MSNDDLRARLEAARWRGQFSDISVGHAERVAREWHNEQMTELDEILERRDCQTTAEAANDLVEELVMWKQHANEGWKLANERTAEWMALREKQNATALATIPITSSEPKMEVIVGDLPGITNVNPNDTEISRQLADDMAINGMLDGHCGKLNKKIYERLTSSEKNEQ